MLPFEIGHWDFFEPSQQVLECVTKEDMLKNLQNPSIDMATICKDNDVLCIAGITTLRVNVGEVWLLLDEKFYKYSRSAIKGIKWLMYEQLAKAGYRRIQMAVLPHRARWASWLGFKLEGTMKSYDEQGRDHLLFARVL